MTRFILIIVLIVIVLAQACSTERVTVDSTPLERVVLIDEKGKQWDVTQAVHRYGFNADRFLFGFGAFSVLPLISPPMLSVGEQGFPAPGDTFDVAGIDVEGDERAYGIRELIGFEAINDNAGSRAVVLTYDPLAETVFAYVRTTAETSLTLSASGWVYADQNVFFDYETESLWYRLDGVFTCINGPFFGNTLTDIPVTRQQWSQWFATRPDTRVLVLPDPPPQP